LLFFFTPFHQFLLSAPFMQPDNTKTYKNRCLFRGTFGFCFLFLYCLPMALAGAFWFSNDADVAESSTEHHSSFSDNSHSTWESMVLFRFSPKPKQQETAQEVDTEEDENENLHNRLLSIFLDELSKKAGSASGFIYKESLLQTRRELALFVLHHSWRTFIF